MQLKPINDFVVVEPDQKEEKSESGLLFLPDEAKKESVFGTALAVGPGKDDVPMVVKAGDRVLFIRRFNSEVEFGGKKLRILNVSDILAVVEESDDL